MYSYSYILIHMLKYLLINLLLYIRLDVSILVSHARAKLASKCGDLDSCPLCCEWSPFEVGLLALGITYVLIVQVITAASGALSRWLMYSSA